MSLLEVRDLTCHTTGAAAQSLLREVSFAVEAGEIVGLVGESGSGKTMASLALLGLLPGAVRLTDGSATLDGRELIDPAGRVHRSPHDLTMIFQNPRGALNPTMRVGRQIGRVLRLNQGASRSQARREVVEALGRVGVPGPERVARAYPHQLSGGMCQRVMIAMALACRPRVLIADEPTTGLDVTIQAQIFDLLKALVADTGCGVLFITHDLAAVAEMCDRVVVLYGGQVMETGATVELFAQPRHPYTRYLLESVHQAVDPRSEDKGVDFSLPGCRYAHRCRHAFEACDATPPLVAVGGPDHLSACFLHAEDTVAPA